MRLTNQSGAVNMINMEKMSLSIKLKNRLVDLDKIKKAVSSMSTTVDCARRKFQEIDLVLEELFTNIVCHGFNDNKEHEIHISLSCDDDTLMIRMEDDGKPFDVTAAKEPDTKCAIEKRCIGGLGIHFVKHFIDECNYQRKKNRNIVVLKKYITNDAQQLETDSESR
ncbi:MAG: ATP-binding protein [Desulfobacula sp.]|nr:ATP-binding protein [Desulfobacula sp.]